MEIDIDPVYIKDENINNVRGNRHIKLCTTVTKVYPGEIYGAQKMNNIWVMYSRTNKIGVALIISGFVLDGKYIEVFDENPLILDGGKSQNVLLSKTFRPQYPLMWSWPFSRGILNSN